MKLTWLGHACFKIESQGYTIIIDPYEDSYVPGFGPLRESADMVLCTHGHADHGAKELIRIKNDTPCPFRISEISTWHDDQRGALRGKNTIYILDDGCCRAAHLGDLGCELEKDQLEQLKNLDAVMIPIGGFYTIDAGQAVKLIRQTEPRVVLPMHYRGKGFGYDVLGTVEDFTQLCDDVITYEANSIEITKDTNKQTAVLKAPLNF
ncbi:MAG: MBL fold metallo-hydrolase [Enterocloster sp.]